MDEQDLSYSGPGDPHAERLAEQRAEADLDGTLPDGLTPDVAAYGSGGIGAVLMAFTGWLKKRRARNRAND